MATDNRTTNICLINTQKVITQESIVVEPMYEGELDDSSIQKEWEVANNITDKNKKILEQWTDVLAEDNTIGIDHNKSYIWFNTKDDRDNYFALKTVKTQTRNSKIHDFNNPKSFRIGIGMKDFYALNIDLIKVNHTVNGIEDEYFYGITGVNYVNDSVTVVSVKLKTVYTQFLDDTTIRNQVEGVINKSNFKNQNYDINYINNITKGIIGDDYGATDYSSSIKFVESGVNDKDGTSWLVASLRKKPSVVDDAVDLSLGGYANTLNSNFSDEIIIAMPFHNATGLGRSLQAGSGSISPNANRIGYVAYLLLNGTVALKSSLTGTVLASIAGSYKYVEQLPFTFASLYDVTEIGIIPDFPGNYEDSNNIVTMPSGAEILKFTLKDKTKTSNAEREIYFTTFKHVEGNFKLNKETIMPNADKWRRLFNGFENVENNIVYNNYYLKYYNTLTTLNPYNLFGSNADLYVSSIYLGSKFKKLFVSTDLGIEGLPKVSQLTAVKNTDFVIKYFGKNNGGNTINDYLADNMIADIDTNNSIISDVVRGGLTVGGGVIGSLVPGAGTIAGGVAGGVLGGAITGNSANALSKQSSNLKNAARDFNQQGGTSGYNASAFNTSPMFSELEEYVPKIVYERSGNTLKIDQQTNFYGTSCSIYTNNLKNYIKDVINDRKNKSCYIAGDFNINFMYPLANEDLKNELANGILFKRKL